MKKVKGKLDPEFKEIIKEMAIGMVSLFEGDIDFDYYANNIIDRVELSTRAKADVLTLLHEGKSEYKLIPCDYPDATDEQCKLMSDKAMNYTVSLINLLYKEVILTKP